MHEDQQKEQFSRAYVQAVAACAGFAWSVPSVDDDSIDMTLAQTGGRGTFRSPKLDLQIKCQAAATPSDSRFSFSLKLKTYDDLREPTVFVPRILVVVLVPTDPTSWLMHSEVELALRHCGYWSSLRGLPQSANEASQTVTMKRDRIFNITALRAMMRRVGSGDLP